MHVLAIDVGSSSVKAAVLRGGRFIGKPARVVFPTRYTADRAEVDPDDILSAMAQAIQRLGSAAKKVDVISLDTMSPSWLAMDSRGNALTPIVTHQDRRSTQLAMQLEQRIGKQRHLQLCGSRPVPGGISSTTCAWFFKNQPRLMRRADLVGHVQTFLHRRLCGVRVADPSHASFMGLYSTLTLGGWNDELCDAIGISRRLLPEVREANEVGGKILPQAALRLGLTAGTPMLVGFIDTGAAMMLAGAKPGQLVNVVGSTDVLALCTDRPRPREGLLTRALGVGRRWISAATIGAAGSSLLWMKREMFADFSDVRFFKMVESLTPRDCGQVRFEPYLAGDRVGVEQRQAGFSGLTLSATRKQMLAAVIDALSRESARRIELLKSTGTRLNHRVLISGGGSGALAKIMHRDWPGTWDFLTESEATLRGLEVLAGSRETKRRRDGETK